MTIPSSIPEACMAYTAVFTTWRLEFFCYIAVGIAIGLLAGMKMKK